MPTGATKATARLMLQAMLQERFHLVVHHELAEQSGFALVVAKGGHRLRDSTFPDLSALKDGRHDKEMAAALLNQIRSARYAAPELPAGVNRQGFNRVTASEIAVIVSQFVDAPVIDGTGLDGTYDISIDLARDDPDYTIQTALEKLGLKLEKRRVQTDTLVVDRLDKAPTPN